MSLNEHWTRKKGRKLPKKAYTSLSDAVAFLDENPKLKEKYSPYICSVCGKWHIGHLHKKK
jgi:hypothetical protein